jgi:hypothetical protein
MNPAPPVTRTDILEPIFNQVPRNIKPPVFDLARKNNVSVSTLVKD